MNTRSFTATMALCSFATLSTVSQASLNYTFDSDPGGWQRANYTQADNPTFNGFSAAAWNSGGWIEGPDFANYAYHVSPDLGGMDLTGLYGQTFEFDYWTDYDSTSALDPFVIITTTTKQIYMPAFVFGSTGFVHHSYVVSDGAGWRVAGGGAASAQDMLDVLGNVQYVGVSADVVTGSDFTRLDNVSFVPEPASLAVLGLGAFALLRKRR